MKEVPFSTVWLGKSYDRRKTYLAASPGHQMHGLHSSRAFARSPPPCARENDQLKKPHPLSGIQILIAFLGNSPLRLCVMLWV